MKRNQQIREEIESRLSKELAKKYHLKTNLYSGMIGVWESDRLLCGVCVEENEIIVMDGTERKLSRVKISLGQNAITETVYSQTIRIIKIFVTL